MSCWVAPALAAEYWGVSLPEVLDCIADGALLMQREGGFLFVDVLPVDAAYTPWGARQRREAPATFVALSDAEVEALQEDVDQTPFDEEPQDQDTPAMGSHAWRTIREQTGRLRRRPIAA